MPACSWVCIRGVARTPSFASGRTSSTCRMRRPAIPGRDIILFPSSESSAPPAAVKYGVYFACAFLNCCRVSSYTGYPSLGAMFNQPLEKQGVRGCLSADILSYFGVLLEAQKFCNRVSKTMFACLEGAEGVSEATVRLLEEEFDQVERTLGGSGTGMISQPLLAPLGMTTLTSNQNWTSSPSWQSG